MRIVFLSWRDVAHPLAGGSELVLDRLASGLFAPGHDVGMLHGGPSAPHEYPAHTIGGTYTPYVRAPIAFHRRTDRGDVVVDVEAGVPYFSPWLQPAPAG